MNRSVFYGTARVNRASGRLFGCLVCGISVGSRYVYGQEVCGNCQRPVSDTERIKEDERVKTEARDRSIFAIEIALKAQDARDKKDRLRRARQIRMRRLR